MTNRTVKILLSGSVQGCGVRPALARLAAKNGWAGSVRNTTDGVELILAGTLPDDSFIAKQVRAVLPEQAAVGQLIAEPGETSVASGFSIEPSASVGYLRGAQLPRDKSICQECLAEVRDVQNRRYAYPFTNCAECGPRFSILLGMPFDRERTTMNEFRLCDQCRHEYNDPSDRRFHAQTICCPECGPYVWSTEASGALRALRDDAIRDATDVLRAGGVVCIRGLGGYQLLTDATSAAAVIALRTRKCRPAKPFAVLCRNLSDVRALAVLNDIEAEQLTSLQNPIVLVRQRPGSGLAPQVNPGLNDVGVLLPTTALHDRLAQLVSRPLICTSGNLEGEPLAYELDDAQNRLRNIANLFLHHNRDIVRPIDDSVVRVIAGRPVTIRCARGLAPLPLELPGPLTSLAVGGHQKSTIALSWEGQSLLGPHIGDLDTVASRERWCGQLRGLLSVVAGMEQPDNGRRYDSSVLLDAPLDQLAHDPHPEYFSTRLGQQAEVPKVGVWHHHAHIASGLMENQWLDRTVLGVAFDGTGLGPDGTIWGGEFLVTSATHSSRVAHLRPFGLAGGEAAIADLRRTAVGLLSDLEELSPNDIADLTGLTRHEVLQFQKVLRLPQTIPSSSCGRLFDAAACLILRQHRAGFEGQGAMCLEAACDRAHPDSYRFTVSDDQPLQVDWRTVVSQIIADQRAGVAAGAMAMRFHRGLAGVIIDVCGRWPELPVVLGGGVFQNRILVEMLAASWPADRAPLGLPGLIPPNDGGLAAGQLVVANALANERGY